MGLDQWLDGVIYKEARKCNDGKRRIEKTLEITWRKDWHFHDWFLQHTDFDSGSGSFEIDYEHLNELKSICKKVLDNKDLAESLLKDYYNEYDKYYWNSIKKTYNKLNILIDEEKYDWFEYSWWG